ncbi:MAG: sigma-54 dependent transcriptional regulator [Cyclobacteriaceae bacterium]|jgi:DNA-binding NtrC family response regulator|nr:sigma-54 dependent transcriptional regulator [Cytophagales bacterium]MCZ8326961.1 sigma-54 dependent transcriptional regulator [Cyclobacteriaceae bacterium]
MYEKDPVKIFVVEDDPAYNKFLRYVLELNPDFDVEFFTTGKSCLQNLYKNPSIVTLDYSLPDMAGEQILKEILAVNPDIQIIIVSAQEKISTAVDLMLAGAYYYIPKDTEAKDRLLYTIKNAREKVSQIKEISQLKKEISEKYEFEKSIIGTSVSIRKVFDLMEKAVKTNISVSITGETGTGKELVAKAIHYNSKRKGKPFVAVNIAAIPKDLIESELFGHEKGAFTGAITRRVGKFEEADGGTLFLDEIGEMDLNLQAKLLRVLQEREVVRVGGNQVIKLDVRIIAATHRDLALEVKEGRFREDLYYRLLGLPIHLPPLRDRGSDVVVIAKHFLDHFAKENNLPKFKITPEAQEKLMSHTYPGNIRELKSIIELSAVMTDDQQVKPSDITFNTSKSIESFLNQEMKMEEYMFRIIRHYLNKYDNDVLEVARILDIGKSSIYRYLKDMEAAGI